MHIFVGEERLWSTVFFSITSTVASWSIRPLLIPPATTRAPSVVAQAGSSRGVGMGGKIWSHRFLPSKTEENASGTLLCTIIMKSTKVQTFGAYHSTMNLWLSACITKIEELAKYMSFCPWKITLISFTFHKLPLSRTLSSTKARKAFNELSPFPYILQTLLFICMISTLQ